MNAIRRNAYGMLRKLPAVFDLRDVSAIFGLEHAYAKNCCSRWAEREMIKSLGPRAGVYFNLVVDPKGATNRIKEAVDKLLRRPVIAIGAFALHQHGWTTQRPQGMEIAVPTGGLLRTFPSMYGIAASGRSRAWFQAVMPDSEEGISAFLTAPAEFALVDALMSKGRDGVWCPAPDDIDPPSDVEPVDAVAAIRKASEELGADRDMIEDFMSRVDALEDAIEESGPRP